MSTELYRPGLGTPTSSPQVTVPAIGSKPDVLQKWVDGGIYYGHLLRVRDVSNYRRADLYDQGAQWLRQAMAGYEGSGNTLAQWIDVYWAPDDPAYIPTPVFNEGVGARINESARLARPNYRPLVTPRSGSPDVRSREAAKLTQDLIGFRLKEGHWDDKQSPLLYYHMPLYGGAWWKSEWVQTWDHITTVPVLSAVTCPACGLTLASPTLTPQQAGQLPGAAGNAVGNAVSNANGMQNCPMCPDHPPLQPFQPTMEEASSMRDSVGRSMGRQVPLGDWFMTVRSPYDIFVRNMGLDTVPGEIRDLTEVHVEHLDWMGLRWPDKVGQVVPENSAALARYHPIAGAPDIMTALLDYRMFENCARVKERHLLPYMEAQQDQTSGEWVMRLNKGRSVVMVGKVVMFDGTYLMDSANYPGQSVERVLYDYIPWEFIDGGRRLQGQGLWQMMFDPQDSVNQGISQTQAVRKRLAIPLYLALRSHNFMVQGMKGGVPGMIAEIEPDPTAPNVVPQIINNTTIDAGVQREIEYAVQALGRFAGYVEVEKGQPPPNVSAGNAIAFLKGAAGERREPRLARIKASLKRGWSHGARLMAHMYLEPRPYSYKDEDAEERWKYVHGVDLDQQTDVTIDGEPDFDSAAKQVEVMRDMIQLRVIDPAESPAKRRRIAQLMDRTIAEELFEDDDSQDKDAQREWIDYRDSRRVPRVDPGLDDNSTHYEQHGRACHTAIFRNMELKGGWDDALKTLGDSWFETLDQVAMMPGPPDLQDRILMLWVMALQQVGFRPPDPVAFGFVLVWRAHTEAHRLEDEMKQMRAMQGPQLAAPGSPATAAGNQPTPGAPPMAALMAGKGPVSLPAPTATRVVAAA